MKSQHCQEILRRENAGLGNRMDVGSDRVGVTMRLPAWMGNRQKPGLGE